ncbi:hypothetical protein NKH77_29025 [Streptomyces sp. M19]
MPVPPAPAHAPDHAAAEAADATEAADVTDATRAPDGTGALGAAAPAEPAEATATTTAAQTAAATAAAPEATAAPAANTAAAAGRATASEGTTGKAATAAVAAAGAVGAADGRSGTRPPGPSPKEMLALVALAGALLIAIPFLFIGGDKDKDDEHGDDNPKTTKQDGPGVVLPRNGDDSVSRNAVRSAVGRQSSSGNGTRNKTVNSGAIDYANLKGVLVRNVAYGNCADIPGIGPGAVDSPVKVGNRDGAVRSSPKPPAKAGQPSAALVGRKPWKQAVLVPQLRR